MRRAGQFTVIEQVILFGLGVAIASGFLVAFQNFGQDIKQDALRSQSRALASVISLNTVELVQTGADGRESFQLPQSIAGGDYLVRFSSDGVTVVAQEVTATVGVAGLTERYNLTGSVSSRFQQAIVIKEDNVIRITGG